MHSSVLGELPGAANLSAHDISGDYWAPGRSAVASGFLSLDIRSWPTWMAFLSLRSDHWMTLPVKVVVE